MITLVKPDLQLLFSSHSTTSIVSEPPKEQKHTMGQGGEEHHSLRKPIPAQWLPKRNGPNLATAQRAKDRSQKKTSQSGSSDCDRDAAGNAQLVRSRQKSAWDGGDNLPHESKLLLLSRTTSHRPAARTDSVDHPKSRLDKVPTFLAPRSSPRRRSALTIKTSPTRATFLGAVLAPTTQSRPPTSVATSASGKSFHTAGSWPVRSCAGSELSFRSAAESFEDHNTECS